MVLQFSPIISGKIGDQGYSRPLTWGENRLHGGAKCAKWLRKTSPWGFDSPISWPLPSEPLKRSRWNHKKNLPSNGSTARSHLRAYGRCVACVAWARDASEVQAQLLHGGIGQQFHCLRLRNISAGPKERTKIPREMIRFSSKRLLFLVWGWFKRTDGEGLYHKNHGDLRVV